MPESPAVTLRRAAEKLRGLANAATPGPWRATSYGEGDMRSWYVTAPNTLVTTGLHEDDDELVAIEHDGRDAALIAAMHPGAARLLAIMWDEFAELLDGHSEINLSQDPGDDYSLVMWDGREYRHDWSAVLKTARAYLDEA